MKYIVDCLLLCLLACQQHEVVDPMDEPVELAFKLDLTDVGSRGLEGGDYLDKVSVYIVDASKNIIAKQENITIQNQATEVEVTFDKSYNLKRGVHTLMAVANHGTLTDFSSISYDNLMNSKVHTTNGTDNVSPKNIVQPLSLMKEIELHAGNNQVEGELVRTFARLRIEVKNNSGSLPLKVNGLTFSDNLTQQQAYVFDDGTDRKYFDPTGAPVSTSNHALTPFAAQQIAVQTSGVMFDAYLLESKAGSGEVYTYTLDLAYEGASSTQISYSKTGNAIGNVNNLNVGNESYFLIYNTNSGSYLSAGDNVVVTSTLGNDDMNNLGTHVVWQVTRNGNYYYLKNVETGQYMQGLARNSNVALGSTEIGYTLSSHSNSTVIRLRNNNRYLRVKNGDVESTSSSSSDNSRNFQFYSVTKNVTQTGGGTITYNAPITLTTIDPITQQSSPTTAIKRNDYINVLVTVSYNPVAGKFEFVVQDWNTGGGDVEFN